MDAVRIDKFLWAIRVYKTRTDATDACKGGKVTVGGADVKPAREVKAGDVITVRKGPILYTYKVLAPLEKRVGAKDVPRFAENLTPQSELDKLHAPVETFSSVATGEPAARRRRNAATWSRSTILSLRKKKTDPGKADQRACCG